MRGVTAVLVCSCLAVATALAATRVSGAESSAAPKASTLPPESVKLKESQLPGYVIASAKCVICHSVDYVAYQPPGMTEKQWTAEMVKMQHVYGAPIDEGEIKLLAAYLATEYGNAASVGSDTK